MNQTSMSQFAHPSELKPNDRILFDEDVFIPKHTETGTRYENQGKRTVGAVLIGAGSLPGYVLLSVLKSTGPNALFAGAQIERPVHNLKSGYLVPEGFIQENIYKAGGHLVGYVNGKKVVMDNADKGGMSVGSTHAQGGIQGEVAGSNRIEFEHKEPVLTTEINNDDHLYDFNGEKKTARQIASEINVANGGRAFADGGDTGTDANPVRFKGGEIILTAPVTSDTRSYQFEGKSMTALEIASHINQKNGGVALAKDGMATCGC